MNKEEYFKLRKLEKQKEENEKIWEQLTELFRWQNYFKKPDSKQALDKIREYTTTKMRILLNKTTREYDHLKIDMLSKCSHEILIKYRGHHCAYCHNVIVNDINSLNPKIIIDVSMFPHTIYESQIIPIIYQNIDDSLFHNLDPIEHLKIIEEQIKSINISPSFYLDYLDLSEFKLELRRNDNA